MPDKFLFKPVPHEEAVAFVRNKPVVSREAFDHLLPALNARAFAITGIESANVLQRVRDRIAELPAGADWDKLKAEIIEDVSPYLVDPAADAETQAKQMEASERRAELLLRTHGFEAYQAASYEVMDRQRDVFPFWQYMTMEDEAVRDTHAALDGLILPSNSPFWNDHYPPWDWGCRCQVVPIMEEEMQAVKEGESDYGRVLSDNQQKRLETGGELDLGNGRQINVSSPTASGKENAFSWTPGDLRIPLEQLEQRYDPEVWKTFRAWSSAQKIDDEGRTVWGWLNQKPGTPLKQPATKQTIPQLKKLPELSDSTPRTSKLNPPDSKLPKDLLAWKKTAPASTKEALKTYTVAPSKVNDPLRAKGATKDTLTGEARKMSEDLTKAFSTQPQFKEPIRTWRGISLDEKQSTTFLNSINESMKAGKPLQMKGYTSTSLDPAYANGWAGDVKTGYVFEIEAKHGIYIDEKTSSVSGQREMLLDHDTKYEIKGIKEVQMEHMGKLYSRKVIELIQL